ncbi:hypothetical protein MM213_14745 [Belliella sp. R4-6]|uniref:Uncharacterized protein n=1 Tax=Belliella alkalica TaxID=1730871 RepID=A0ABS9VE93_9BACT|nr:hypothetical protein [Belliella alkalica]MCH7414756.1 hypothetical protein [Belliella alkalica]
MNRLDIKYLEEKLAERPFRWEELYFEILDHVLCKYEASGINDVEAFWEQEKSNWSWQKIYKLRFFHHISLIWLFLYTFLKSLFSIGQEELKFKIPILVLAVFIGFTFFENSFNITTALIVFLWFGFPTIFQTWIYHSRDTLGEKSLLLRKKSYVSAKRDAMWTCLLACSVFWQIIFDTSRKILDLDGYFAITYYHPIISSIIIYMFILSARAFYTVYSIQLKPFLYGAN